MRVRHLVFLASASLFIAGAAAVGCGGSTSDSTPAEDAGKDVSTADQTADSAVVCVDASLRDLAVPDASLDGSSTGACLACVESKCGSAVTACDNDCTCRNGLYGLYSCLGEGDVVSCVADAGSGAFAGSGNSTVVSLAACVYLQCASACAMPALPGIDAGNDASQSADASLEDAPTDG
jgi:hypothetical protein